MDHFTRLADCLLTTNIVGSSVGSLVADMSSESAAVFSAQARELPWRAFQVSTRRLVGNELAMYTALREAIHNFRFDYSRTQVIWVNDTRDSPLTGYWPGMSHDSYTSIVHKGMILLLQMYVDSRVLTRGFSPPVLCPSFMLFCTNLCSPGCIEQHELHYSVYAWVFCP